MKKTFIRLILSLLVFLGGLSVISFFSYTFISKSVLKNNIGTNLSTAMDSTVYSLNDRLDSDYSLLKTAVDTITAEIPEEDDITKATYLSEHKDLIPFLHGKSADFCSFNPETGYFNVKGIEYRDKNSNIDKFKIENKIIFCNFKDDFEPVHNDVTSSFTRDTVYLVFVFDNICLYYDAPFYLSSLLNSNSNLEIVNFYFMTVDGRIYYQKYNSGKTIFYEILRNSNVEHNVAEIRDSFLDGTVNDRFFSNITVKDRKCYLCAKKINGDIIDSNLYLTIAYSSTSADISVRKATWPLIATYVVFIIFLVVAVYLSYYILRRKNNDINMFMQAHYGEPVYIMRAHENGDVYLMNKAMKKMLKDRKKYKNIDDFNVKEKYPHRDMSIKTQRPFTMYFNPEDTTDGNFICVRFTIIKHFSNFIFLGTNTTKDEEEYIRYRNIALINPYTNLPNREVLKNSITEMIEYIQTSADKQYFSVIIIEMKNYKNLKNYYGATFSIEIIDRAKDVLLETVPLGSKLYSLNEAVFAVTIKSDAEYKGVTEWLNTVNSAFSHPVEIGKSSLFFNMVYGIYNIDLDEFSHNDPDDIIKCATTACDKAKNNKNTNYEVYTLAIDRYVSDEKQLEADIEAGINNNEFVMYMQPQYNNYLERISGFEMLIRWNNKKYASVSPQVFIEIAEKKGLIIQMGQFITDEAMRVAKEMEKYDVEISVNVSPVQILQSGFVQSFIEAADKYHVKYSNVALEITETFLMENFDIVIEKLKVIKKKGFRIHLDDFGTGYSSLLYLRELPVDTIKIDQEFTKYVVNDAHSRSIVQKTIQLAKSLDLDIIAEGVETEAQNNFLYNNKCDIIQGFLISKAVPYDDAIKLIEDYNIKKTKKVNRKGKK